MTTVFASPPPGLDSKMVEDIPMEVADTLPCPAAVIKDSSMEKSKAEARNKLSALSAMVSGIKASDLQVAKRLALAKIASDIADAAKIASDIADASTLFLFAKIEKIEADIKALLANL